MQCSLIRTLLGRRVGAVTPGVVLHGSQQAVCNNEAKNQNLARLTLQYRGTPSSAVDRVSQNAAARPKAQALLGYLWDSGSGPIVRRRHGIQSRGYMGILS